MTPISIAVAYVIQLEVPALQAAEYIRKFLRHQGISIPYQFGTMIEVPRGALTAERPNDPLPRFRWRVYLWLRRSPEE